MCRLWRLHQRGRRHDQALRDRRLERYQELFRRTGLFHRYYLIGEEPRRKDLAQFRLDCDAWYFGEAAGGMFLTKAAKDVYMQMMKTVKAKRIHR